MESILFNQLTESDYGQDNDELLLQQNGITKRIKSKNFFDGAIANAMHEKYTAGRLLVADDDGNIAESEKTEADLDRAGSAVTYTEQTLTDAQKAQARTNVGLQNAVTIYNEKQVGYPFSITETYTNSKAANIPLSSVIPNYSKATMGTKLRGCFATSHVGVSVVATTNQENIYTTFAQNVTGTFTIYGMIFLATE